MIDDNPVVALADLLGFIGAILLAIPFFRGQRSRDTVLIAMARPSREKAFDRTIQGKVADIANY
jgi:hypothetical protein